MKPNPDIQAEVIYFSADYFTNKEYLSTDYSIRHDHLIKDDYLTCGDHDYLGKEKIYAQKKYKTNIRFISPEAYPHSLWVGKKIQIQRGNWVIGEATVVEIYNELLKQEKSQPEP